MIKSDKQIYVIAKKKKKKKQGTIKTARQWGDSRFPLPSRGNSSFENQGEYTPLSNRWQRIKRLLDTRTGSPVRRSRCRNSCINLRARGYSGGCNGCGMRESVRDYEIPLCTDTVVSASRRRGWKSILLRTYQRGGRGLNMKRDRREK